MPHAFESRTITVSWVSRLILVMISLRHLRALGTKPLDDGLLSNCAIRRALEKA